MSLNIQCHADKDWITHSYQNMYNTECNSCIENQIHVKNMQNMQNMLNIKIKCRAIVTLWSSCQVGNHWIVNSTPIPECLWQRPCGVALDAIPEPMIVDLCGVVGRATAFIGGAVVSIPAGSALKLRQWIELLGCLVVNQLGNPHF
jgi:hypothetical protein